MAVFRGALIEDASAEFQHQHQKLRTQCAELLAKFRAQTRITSMIAHSKTSRFSIGYNRTHLSGKNYERKKHRRVNQTRGSTFVQNGGIRP